MTAPDEPVIFSNEWRAARIRVGDAYLAEAATEPAAYKAHVLTAMANAHYAAANVRGRDEGFTISPNYLTPNMTEQERALMDND